MLPSSQTLPTRTLTCAPILARHRDRRGRSDGRQGSDRSSVEQTGARPNTEISITLADQQSSRLMRRRDRNRLCRAAARQSYVLRRRHIPGAEAAALHIHILPRLLIIQDPLSQHRVNKALMIARGRVQRRRKNRRRTDPEPAATCANRAQAIEKAMLFGRERHETFESSLANLNITLRDREHAVPG